jgi:hypothetical protein
MKKLLTTITLLCFSFAANADIYFCQPRHYAESNQNFTLAINKEEFDNERYDPDTYSVIVDTEKGMSDIGLDNYEGSCDENSTFIKCERETDLLSNGYPGFTTVVINKSKREFVETFINANNSTGFTISGTCIKA